MRVSVPASTANLGPGFDCLALALELRFHLDVGEPHSDDSGEVSTNHPAAVAFARGGGTGPLHAASSIAPGKGLGYSGAAHVAGAAAASLQRNGWIDFPDLFARATELEGHPDNAAASIHGGLTVTAGGRVVRLPHLPDLQVVVWIPDHETSTTSSRHALPDTVAFDDAVHNVARSSLFVAAYAMGDVEALTDACADRLHQDRRLAAAPDSAAALKQALEAGAVAAWLSGSGPTIAALVRSADAAAVSRGLPASGHSKVLLPASFGVQVRAGADV